MVWLILMIPAHIFFSLCHSQAIGYFNINYFSVVAYSRVCGKGDGGGTPGSKRLLKTIDHLSLLLNANQLKTNKQTKKKN